MIVCVSIVDKHLPEGKRHVGTYMFEVEYPDPEHPGQMDFHVCDGGNDKLELLRPYLNRLLSRKELALMQGGARNGDGERVDENGKVI